MKQPKEVAEKLKVKFGKLAPDVVDEIIEALEFHWKEFDKLEMCGSANSILFEIENWQAVKKELNQN